MGSVILASTIFVLLFLRNFLSISLFRACRWLSSTTLLLCHSASLGAPGQLKFSAADHRASFRTPWSAHGARDTWHVWDFSIWVS